MYFELLKLSDPSQGHTDAQLCFGFQNRDQGWRGDSSDRTAA
jgi:hypothetical protein